MGPHRDALERALLEHGSGAGNQLGVGPGLVGGGLLTSQGVAGDPLVAVSAQTVWWAYLIDNGNGKEASGGLMHWDGTTWRRARLPTGLLAIGGMAQDGQGGIWLAADSDFYHYRNGHWTGQLMPKGQSAGTTGIARIPGTTAMWAIGSADGLHGQNKSFGLIMGYGR